MFFFIGKGGKRMRREREKEREREREKNGIEKWRGATISVK